MYNLYISMTSSQTDNQLDKADILLLKLLNIFLSGRLNIWDYYYVSANHRSIIYNNTKPHLRPVNVVIQVKVARR